MSPLPTPPATHTITFFAPAALAKSSSVTSKYVCWAIRGELPSQEQTTCNGNSRWSSVCLLARIEWNNRGQPETPARRSSRVISERRLAFFQPIAVLAAAQYCGAATTYSLLWPSGPPSRPTQYILEIPNSAYSRSPQCNISHETTSYNLDGSPEKNLG